MSPLDDELRAALSGRAQAVTPAPDPLAGIERRAKQIQRTRIGAAVAGSALAVALVAAVVPAVQGATSSGPPRGQFATSAPTLVATPSPYALDPTDPWDYRGIPLEDFGPGSLDEMAREYAIKHRVAEESLALVPLFGLYDESSDRRELVFLADVAGELRWGVTHGGHAGSEFPWDEPLPDPAYALAAALPGDEVPRLLVVAAPEVGEIGYSPNGAADFTTLRGPLPGVGIIGLEGDVAADRYRVLDPNGGEVLRAPAPDLPRHQPEGPPPGDDVPAPGNAVDWPTRGGLSAELQEQALADFASAAGRSRDQIGSRLLFAGQRGNRVYVLLQAWADGDARAYGWFYDTEDGTSGGVLHAPTALGPAAIAVSVDGVLLVVPEPTAGQVLYSRDGRSEPQPVPDQGTGAAVLIDRPETTTGDRLLILDGDGDPDRPIYRGTVQELIGTDG